jgi:hypothetical protein
MFLKERGLKPAGTSILRMERSLKKSLRRGVTEQAIGFQLHSRGSGEIVTAGTRLLCYLRKLFTPPLLGPAFLAEMLSSHPYLGFTCGEK